MLANNALRNKMDKVGASTDADERADRDGIDGWVPFIQHVDEHCFSGRVPDKVTHDHCFGSTAESTVCTQNLCWRHLT